MRTRPLPPPRSPSWHFCHTSPRVLALGLAVFALVYATAPTGADGAAAPVVTWLLDDDVGEHWVEVYVIVGGAVGDQPDGTSGAVQTDGAEVALQRVTALVGDEPVDLTYRAWGSWAASHRVPAGSEVRFEGLLEDGGTVTSPPVAWPS